MKKWIALMALVSLMFLFSCGDDDDDNDDATISPAVGPWSFSFSGTSTGEGRFDLNENAASVAGHAAGLTDDGVAFEMDMDGTLIEEELNLTLDGVLSGQTTFDGGFWGTLGETTGSGEWQIVTDADSTSHGQWEAQYTG